MRVGLPADLTYECDQSEGGQVWRDLRFIVGEPEQMIAWASHVLACAIAEHSSGQKDKR